VQVDAALGKEGDTTLGVGRGVLGQVFELVVLVFVVADVSVAAVVSVAASTDSQRKLTPCRLGTGSLCRHPRRACIHQKSSRESGTRQWARWGCGGPTDPAGGHSCGRSRWSRCGLSHPSTQRGCSSHQGGPGPPEPSGLHESDCTMSLCLSVSLAAPASTSHILTV
jgi:hypothetical protein